MKKSFRFVKEIFILVLILFIFGGSSLNEFTFILLVGFIVGTYSSIFISATLLKDLVRRI